ncbi:putative helitron helicase-like domain-containing protein [Tanacetum coccineum]
MKNVESIPEETQSSRINKGMQKDQGLKENDPSNPILFKDFTSSNYPKTVDHTTNNLRHDTHDKGNKVCSDDTNEKVNGMVLSFNDLPYAQINNVRSRKQSSFGYSQILNSIQRTANVVSGNSSQFNTTLLKYQPLHTSKTSATLTSPRIIQDGQQCNTQDTTPSHIAVPLPTISIQRYPLSDITSNQKKNRSPVKCDNMPLPKRGRGRPRKNPVDINVVNSIPLQTPGQSVITTNENQDKSVKGTHVLSQTQHVSVPTVSGSIQVPKRSRGRPRKDSIDTSVVPKKTKIVPDYQNKVHALPSSKVTTQSTILKPLSNINLQRSPLSDITSSTLSCINKNMDASNKGKQLLTPQSNVNIQVVFEQLGIQKKKCGRPCKTPVTSDISSSTTEVGSSEPLSRNKRGRPRKKRLENGDTSNTNPRAKFKNKTPVQFNIGGTLNAKGKSILHIPDFEPSDEDNEDVHGYMSANAFPDINEFEPCDEYIEDEHGYENRIQGISKDYHDHGDPTEQCVKCGALLWLAESRVGSTNSTREGFSLCCGRGLVKLPVSLKNPPPLLMGLLKGEHPKSNSFMDNIRRYNSMFAFTWMTGKQDHSVNRGKGPFCFRIQGKNNHVIGDLLPKRGETPKFGQLYIYDPANEVQNRINVLSSSKDNASSSSNKDIDRELTKNIKAMLDKDNPLVHQYRMAGKQICEGDSNVKIRLIGRRDSDGRQHNLPTADEVAALIVGDFDSMPNERDIIVHEKNGNLKTISELHVSYLPLQYPLLFPYAEDGYRTDIYLEGITDDTPDDKKKYVTMRQWFAYRIQDRPNVFSTILNGKRLFQQFLVDGYTMVEAERLLYVRNQQKELRCETYSRLQQAAESSNPGNTKRGTKVVLPSSFTGGPRYMLQNYLDAMALCKCLIN